MIVIYNPVQNQAVNISGLAERADGTQTVTVPSSFSGDLVQCYLAFKQNPDNGTEISNSAFAGAVTVAYKDYWRPENGEEETGLLLNINPQYSRVSGLPTSPKSYLLSRLETVNSFILIVIILDSRADLPRDNSHRDFSPLFNQDYRL